MLAFPFPIILLAELKLTYTKVLVNVVERLMCVQRVRRANTALRVYKTVAVARTATATTSLVTASANPVTPASTALEVGLFIPL